MQLGPVEQRQQGEISRSAGQRQQTAGAINVSPKGSFKSGLQGNDKTQVGWTNYLRAVPITSRPVRKDSPMTDFGMKLAGGVAKPLP